MNTYIIELHDSVTLLKDYITFSDKEIHNISNIYSQTNSLGSIVEEINNKSQKKEFKISTNKQKLYQVADEIIKDKYGCNTLHGTFRTDRSPSAPKALRDESNDFLNMENMHFAVNVEDKSYTVRPQSKEIHIQRNEYKQKYLPLILVHYNNSYDILNQIKKRIINSGKTPVIWTRSQGLVFDNNEQLHNFSNKIDMSDPHKVIDFIIRKPQKRVDYIFEDFHHYIEKKDQISPSVGKIRSLLKLLHRSLTDRNELIYFVVPAFYELPDELVSVFNNFGNNCHYMYLNRFAQLMTHQDYISRIKPIIGMEMLIERIIQILGQKETNNPLLIGKPGVGKTAIVEGFASLLAVGKLPSKFYGKKLYALSINSLIAGTRYRGDFEIRLEGLMNEVLQHKEQLIIFIDEIHTLLHAGLSEGSTGAGDILKPVLSRGEFPCIGATTPEGNELFVKDPAFSRRFKPVIVHEPSIEKTYEIVKGVSAIFEKHHELKLADDALMASVELSMKHLPHESFPGKAISLIDAAASYASMRGKSIVRKMDVYLEIQKLNLLGDVRKK